jgi:hypothetical protein
MRRSSLLAAALTVCLPCGPIQAEAMPITVDVLFQSCMGEGYSANCTFYGEDRAFDTNEGFGTAPELMSALSELAMNTPLRVTGELFGESVAGAMSYLRVTGFEPGKADPYAELRMQIQGDWVWPDGPDYGLRVTGSEWVSLHAGQEMTMMMLHIAPACPDSEAASAPVLVLRGYDGDPGQFLCLRVDEIDGARMQVYEPRVDVYTEWRRP